MDMLLPLKFTESLPVQDGFQRSLRELRLSVIDRCNFRCTYCMPADSLQGRGVFLPLEKLLTDHEMEDLVRAFVDLGVRKLRITGGEPLVRPGLPALIEQLAAIPGLDDIALTTNGVMLTRLAGDLAEAGLSRLTVSLDTLNQEILHHMSGGKARLGHILEGISAAEAAGFRRIKINTVVQRGVNDHTIMDLLAHFRG
ncbi:MAG: radical SAM protein, partial [Gammaproteobacteria bacterium]|nr:radical SAM protein [Gammaproteobacteria bacterium]